MCEKMDQEEIAVQLDENPIVRSTMFRTLQLLRSPSAKFKTIRYERPSVVSCVTRFFRCLICDAEPIPGNLTNDHMMLFHEDIEVENIWKYFQYLRAEPAKSHEIIKCGWCNALNIVQNGEEIRSCQCNNMALEQNVQQQQQQQQQQQPKDSLFRLITIARQFQCLLGCSEKILDHNITEHHEKNHGGIAFSAKYYSPLRSIDRFECLVCNLRQDTLYDIIKHLSDHEIKLNPEEYLHPDLYGYISMKLYKCSHCKANGIQEGHLELHCSIEHPDVERNHINFELVAVENSQSYVSCNGCQLPHSMQKLIQHLNKSDCEFIKMKKLQSTLSVNCNYVTVSKRYVCIECFSRDFPHSKAMRHVRSKHPGCTFDSIIQEIRNLVEEECPICGYFMLGGLAEHMRSIHPLSLCDGFEKRTDVPKITRVVEKLPRDGILFKPLELSIESWYHCKLCDINERMPESIFLQHHNEMHADIELRMDWYTVKMDLPWSKCLICGEEASIMLNHFYEKHSEMLTIGEDDTLPDISQLKVDHDSIDNSMEEEEDDWVFVPEHIDTEIENAEQMIIEGDFNEKMDSIIAKDSKTCSIC